MEVLLEFNESLHVPPDVRFDLNMPNDPPLLPTPEQEIVPLINDATLAKQAWREAKDGLADGSIDTNAYRMIEDNIKRNKAFAPAQQYSSLSQTHHIAPDAVEKKPDNDYDRKLGYFTPEHETEYYLALDAKLGDEAACRIVPRLRSVSVIFPYGIPHRYTIGCVVTNPRLFRIMRSLLKSLHHALPISDLPSEHQLSAKMRICMMRTGQRPSLLPRTSASVKRTLVIDPKAVAAGRKRRRKSPPPT